MNTVRKIRSSEMPRESMAKTATSVPTVREQIKIFHVKLYSTSINVKYSHINAAVMAEFINFKLHLGKV